MYVRAVYYSCHLSPIPLDLSRAYIPALKHWVGNQFSIGNEGINSSGIVNVLQVYCTRNLSTSRVNIIRFTARIKRRDLVGKRWLETNDVYFTTVIKMPHALQDIAPIQTHQSYCYHSPNYFHFHS